MITVALPLYNSKHIAWVAMESLCNQVDVPCAWELIVYEESGHKAFGKARVKSYTDRLQKAGCVRITYVATRKRVTLLKKWLQMGQLADKESKAFVLQAGDCYSFSQRLARTWQAIQQGADWYDIDNGYFYNLKSGLLVRYKSEKAKTNLSMAFRTDLLKDVPYDQNIVRGIDGYLYDNMSINRVVHDTFDAVDGVDTHGMNNISHWRGYRMARLGHPFEKTDKELSDLPLPLDVKQHMQAWLQV